MDCDFNDAAFRWNAAAPTVPRRPTDRPKHAWIAKRCDTIRMRQALRERKRCLRPCASAMHVPDKHFANRCLFGRERFPKLGVCRAIVRGRVIREAAADESSRFPAVVRHAPPRVAMRCCR
ncbi:hypothetical protein, partial [Burkholderia oklahomensis]|uniref:hypothetical protein n=1 Tax=Burkholderia oklahomensis TaxID=342113 RepID=UPI001E587289